MQACLTGMNTLYRANENKFHNGKGFTAFAIAFIRKPTGLATAIPSAIAW